MQNQLHNQQQQDSQPSLTPPRLEENQIQYRSTENPCDCSNMVMDERDPERCALCNRKYDHLVLSNELNSQGNPVTNEVRDEYDQSCPSSRELELYLNHQMNHQMNQLVNQMMNHQIQPQLPPVREQPPPNTIWFYNRNEIYYEFTNFKEGFPIKAAIREPYPPGSPPDIKSWKTSEHLFQAAKFKNTHPEIADKIRMCRTARDALNMARKYQQYVDPNWQFINVQVMEWVVKTKFEQHPILAKRLLGTGDQKLVEHTEVDRFWGDGGDGSGRNMLGEVLMRVRKQLRDNHNNNNGENNPSGGGTEANPIYSISGPASSSASSLQALHMYAGNGNIHHRITEKGQLPPIPQQQSSPPPLPPRRIEKRDIGRIQEEAHHRDQFQQVQQVQQVPQVQQQFQQQFQQQQQQQQQQQHQIQQQQILQQHQIHQQIQQQIQQRQQFAQIQQMQQQQEAGLNQQYLQQMQPQQHQIANVYITQDGNESIYYPSAYQQSPYNEHNNM